jgi:hypothetical protein
MQIPNHQPTSGMSRKKLLAVYGVSLMIIGLPFTAIHLLARPDDAPITPLQHLVAAIANYFGPWGVAIVRLVDFPNAGLRSFNLALAVLMTFVGAALIVLPSFINQRFIQYSCVVAWSVYLTLWFAVGLRQIADGLL